MPRPLSLTVQGMSLLVSFIDGGLRALLTSRPITGAQFIDIYMCVCACVYVYQILSHRDFDLCQNFFDNNVRTDIR